MAHNLGSITLPEQLTELKEALCLLNYQFIIKGYNSGIARQNRCMGQVLGEGLELPCFLQEPHLPHISLCSPTCLCAKSLQSCPTLCDPMDCSPPGFSVHGILQARILERVAIPFSTASLHHTCKSLYITHRGICVTVHVQVQITNKYHTITVGQPSQVK